MLHIFSNSCNLCIYIFIVYRQQSRMRKNNHYIRSKDHFKLLIPNLIIFTLTIFKIIPDLLLGAALYEVLQMKPLYNIVSHSTVLFNWMVDRSTFYIFISKCKRNHWNQPKYEICWGLSMSTPERRQWHRSGVFILNFEHILHLFLIFLSVTFKN